jgi:hypothetical protein
VRLVLNVVEVGLVKDTGRVVITIGVLVAHLPNLALKLALC